MKFTTEMDLLHLLFKRKASFAPKAKSTAANEPSNIIHSSIFIRKQQPQLTKWWTKKNARDCSLGHINGLADDVLNVVGIFPINYSSNLYLTQTINP